MWCNNCQHGHEPIQKYDDVRGRNIGICPCCGVRLEAGVTKTPEEMVAEFAAKYGLEAIVKPKEQGMVIGEKSKEFNEEIREKSTIKSK